MRKRWKRVSLCTHLLSYYPIPIFLSYYPIPILLSYSEQCPPNPTIQLRHPCLSQRCSPSLLVFNNTQPQALSCLISSKDWLSGEMFSCTTVQQSPFPAHFSFEISKTAITLQMDFSDTFKHAHIETKPFWLSYGFLVKACVFIFSPDQKHWVHSLEQI